MYSLGMTLLYAAKYNLAVSHIDPSVFRPTNSLSSTMTHLLTSMTSDNYDERIEFNDLELKCIGALKGHEPEVMCKSMVAVVRVNYYSSDGEYTWGEFFHYHNVCTGVLLTFSMSIKINTIIMKWSI